MRITSNSRRLRTTLPKYAHFIRDGALPYMVHAKAKVQRIREREREKELTMGEVRVYDRVEEVVVHCVIDVRILVIVAPEM